MRFLDTAEITAIQARSVVARDFLWITAKDRSTGATTDYGFWSDIGTITADVVDGRTGATEARDFYGVGLALNIGTIPLTADVTVRNVDIGLPQIDDVAQLIVRGKDVRGAPIQLFRGYFDPATRGLVAAAKPRFVGYVDGAPIETPAEGGEGSITLNCVSTTRELTRTSVEARSHASQIARAAGDAFYKDTGVVGDWTMFWGQAGGTPAASGVTPGKAGNSSLA